MKEIKYYEPSDIEIRSKDGEMVLREKSLIAFSQNDKKILAIGADAEKMALQNMDGVLVFSPLRRGMIADYLVAVHMFRHMIQKTWGKKLFSKPRIAVFAPEDMTEVERKALMDAMFQAGAKDLLIGEGSPVRFRADMMAADNKQYLSYDLFIVITPEMN